MDSITDQLVHRYRLDVPLHIEHLPSILLRRLGEPRVEVRYPGTGPTVVVVQLRVKRRHCEEEQTRVLVRRVAGVATSEKSGPLLQNFVERGEEDRGAGTVPRELMRSLEGGEVSK